MNSKSEHPTSEVIITSIELSGAWFIKGAIVDRGTCECPGEIINFEIELDELIDSDEPDVGTIVVEGVNGTRYMMIEARVNGLRRIPGELTQRAILHRAVPMIERMFGIRDN